jgi:hypothetical protein
MNLTKNQIVIIASLIVVVVAYFMFFRKKKVTTTKMAAPAPAAESSWSPEYTSDAIALATAQGGQAGNESGYDGLPKASYGKMPSNWLGY